MIKKALLSGLVIISFVVYAFALRVKGLGASNSIPATAPTNSPTPQTTHPESTATPEPTTLEPTHTPPPSTLSPSAQQLKDGTYTGPVTDAFYGNVQVRATIKKGKITDVTFLDYPQDRETSIQINQQAMPLLNSEAIQAQDANVDIVSGATQTSLAFRQSLAEALSQAGG